MFLCAILVAVNSAIGVSYEIRKFAERRKARDRPHSFRGQFHPDHHHRILSKLHIYKLPVPLKYALHFSIETYWRADSSLFYSLVFDVKWHHYGTNINLADSSLPTAHPPGFGDCASFGMVPDSASFRAESGGGGLSRVLPALSLR